MQLDVEAQRANCALNTCAVLLPGGVLSLTIVTVQLPLHLPLE